MEIILFDIVLIRVLQRIGSCVCEGWQVPTSAGWVDTPETQENQTNGVIPILRPAGSRPRKSCCFSLSLKAGKIQCSSSKAVRQEESRILWGGSAFLFYADLQVVGYSLPSLRRTICFTQSTHLNVSLIQKRPDKNTQTVWPDI